MIVPSAPRRRPAQDRINVVVKRGERTIWMERPDSEVIEGRRACSNPAPGHPCPGRNFQVRHPKLQNPPATAKNHVRIKFASAAL